MPVGQDEDLFLNVEISPVFVENVSTGERRTVVELLGLTCQRQEQVLVEKFGRAA
jgi:hypothetical protein